MTDNNMIDYFIGLSNGMEDKSTEYMHFNVIRDSKFKFSDVDKSYDVTYDINKYIDALIKLEDGPLTNDSLCKYKHIQFSQHKLSECLVALKNKLRFSHSGVYNGDNLEQLIFNLESDIYTIYKANAFIDELIGINEFQDKVARLARLYKK